MTMTSLKDENNELHKLVNINKDASEFYKSAAQEAQNSDIKQTFSKLEKLHQDVITNLQNQIRVNGGNPEADETLIGKSAQFWGELMAKISNDVDATLVKHLEEAEDRCLHSMQDAMKDDDIRPATKAALHSEMETLRKTHDYMKALKNAMKAA